MLEAVAGLTAAKPLHNNRAWPAKRLGRRKLPWNNDTVRLTAKKRQASFWSALRSKDRKEILLAGLASFWSLPLAVVCILAKPVCRIHLWELRNDRLGHFVADGAMQVATVSEAANPCRNYHYLAHADTCNSQWEEMLRREINLVPSWFRHVARWLRVLPGGRGLAHPSSVSQSRDLSGLLDHVAIRPSFTAQENSFALGWLKAHGWKPGDPFVCLIVRDKAFTRGDRAANLGATPSFDQWASDDYRNADIRNFADAAKWLTEQGAWVIRMGRVTDQPWPGHNERVVDYASSQTACDLLDIWLFAHADACISTGTGPDTISMVYGRPLLFLNFLPLDRVWSFAHAQTVPKKLLWSDSGRELALSDYLRANYKETKEYRDAGIEVKELSEHEVLTYVQEFWNGLFAGEYQDDSPDQYEAFWRPLSHTETYSTLHGWRHPNSTISPRWLARFAPNGDVFTVE